MKIQLPLSDVLSKIFEDSTLISLTMSSPRRGDIHRIVVRPIIVKGESFYQFSQTRGAQIFHENISAKEANRKILELIFDFKQGLLFTEEADFHLLVNKRGESTLLQKPPSQSKNPLKLAHNKKRGYIISEGVPVSFLVYLGIMNSEGRVYPQKNRKFKQINRFLEMIEDVFPHLNDLKMIHIIDFGCGKAYLTFALYHYLKEIKQREVAIQGLDLKEEVIQECQKIADELGYNGLTFAVGSIEDYKTKDRVDAVISLHACDTATDAALLQAIKWKARVILSVPCCQHELFDQIENEMLKPILKHGILKERFSALLTDALRAEVLESAGYQVNVIEFIDLEHTPKNLLIRAVKRDGAEKEFRLSGAYKILKEAFHVVPWLDREMGAIKSVSLMNQNFIPL